MAALRQGLADPAMEDRWSWLYRVSMNLACCDEEISNDLGKVREVLDVARSCRGATGPGRTAVEEHLMECLEHLVLGWCEALADDDGLEPFVDLGTIEQLDPEFRPGADTVAEVCSFALETLAHKARPRDPAAGARRARAFAVLGVAAGLFDVSAGLEPAREALQRHRYREALGALGYLESYYAAREDEPIPKAIRTELLQLARQAADYDVAAGALHLLVRQRALSVPEAQVRLHRWEARGDARP